MPAKPRQLKPELEHDYSRSPELGYERPDEVGIIRCLSHGFPTPLARWHYHDEYELHLITATSGKAFVGDWIGQFQPGHLVLTGPRLPHNWVTMDLPEGGVAERDLVIQFQHAPLEQACQTIPELNELMPLLERSRHGIEFFGLSERAQAHWHAVKAARGLGRLAAFCEFATLLTRWTDYRLLSNVQLRGVENDAELDQINAIVNRLISNDWLLQSLELTGMAQRTLKTEHHVIVCGYGRSGHNLVDLLKLEGIAYVALDSDPDKVQAGRSAGHHVEFGDATRLASLMSAGLVRASAVVVTYPDTASALKVLAWAQEHAPQVPVVVRTHDDKDLEQLRAAGAAEVVPEVIEGSLMLASQTLAHIGIPLKRVIRLVQGQRMTRYALMRNAKSPPLDDTPAKS